MNRKFVMTLAAGAFALGVQQAQAIPSLTLNDNNGHTTSINLPTGVGTFVGAVGDWVINVTTGIASPPDLIHGGTLSHPYLDLNSVDTYQGNGGAGNQLTVTLTDDNLGPLVGLAVNDIGGTEIGTVDQFKVLLNGVAVPSMNQTFFTPAFSSETLGNVTAAAPATLALQAVLTASSTFATTGFDSQLNRQLTTAPDSGATAILLGLGFLGLAGLRRKIA